MYSTGVAAHDVDAAERAVEFIRQAAWEAWSPDVQRKANMCLMGLSAWFAGALGAR